MVNPFIVRVLAQVITTLGKSALSAYKRVISENIRKGGAASNPFSDFIGKTMESTNLIHKPMSADEAIKILNVKADSPPEQIMNAYMTLFKKNDPLKGGSFYIQSKIHAAKEFLMVQHPEEEKKFMKDYEESIKNEKKENDETEEKTENKEEPKNENTQEEKK